MSTEELRLQIFRQVENIDSSKLKEFYGLMLNLSIVKKKYYLSYERTSTKNNAGKNDSRN
jgi:hypothetical protein